jgi:hypothetical protein
MYKVRRERRTELALTEATREIFSHKRLHLGRTSMTESRGLNTRFSSRAKLLLNAWQQNTQSQNSDQRVRASKATF